MTVLQEYVDIIYEFGTHKLGIGSFADWYNAGLRLVVPVLCVLLLIRIAKSLLTFRAEPEVWGWLHLPGNSEPIPITHWENLIGRHRRSDIVIQLDTISRSHAVLNRYDDGTWSITDVSRRHNVTVNGEPVDNGNTNRTYLQPGDKISLNGLDVTLEPCTKKQEEYMTTLRTKAETWGHAALTLLILLLLQVLMTLQFMFQGGEDAANVVTGFLGIMTFQWGLFLFYTIIRRKSFEVETIAFLLTTFGMALIATCAPYEAKKQLIAMGIGLTGFLFICWCLRDLDRAHKIRYVATVFSLMLLAANLIFGKEVYGARAWISIGGFSFQPSEIVKICFVFVGASTTERMLTKRNLGLFLVYAGIVCGCLALINDFGTALIFLAAFLMIAYLRSGNLGTIALATGAAGYVGITALMSFKPHVLKRFSAWGHVWDDPLNKGYQQTKSMMCIAAGGLFGMGGGRGWMKYMAAADTDVVFATIGEEWGLIVSVVLVLFMALLALFVFRSVRVARSNFYTIAACSAITILMVQTILNVCGTLDLLPFTGVTFPFLSNGGSSTICAWGMLAFIKAADTRQNASFAIRLPEKQKKTGKEDAE